MICKKCKSDVTPVARGTFRLLCGDSTDAEAVALLFGGEKARLVWTDPPYGVGYEEKNAHLWAWDGRLARPSQAQEVANDGDEDGAWEVARLALVAAVANSLPGGVAYVATPPGTACPKAWAAVDAAGFKVRWQLVWLKDSAVFGRSDYHFEHEPILYGWKEDGPHHWEGDRKQTSVFRVDRPRASEEHPTMKPVELVEKMVANSSRPGELVYDPFTGSGTTLIACAKLGRRFVGCEVDPRYADVIRRRWTKFAKSAGLEPGTGALE